MSLAKNKNIYINKKQMDPFPLRTRKGSTNYIGWGRRIFYRFYGLKVTSQKSISLWAWLSSDCKCVKRRGKTTRHEDTVTVAKIVAITAEFFIEGCRGLSFIFILKFRRQNFSIKNFRQNSKIALNRLKIKNLSIYWFLIYLEEQKPCTFVLTAVTRIKEIKWNYNSEWVDDMLALNTMHNLFIQL